MNTPTLVSETPRQVQTHLTELREWLSESLTRCRTMRWFGPAFRFDVAQDIADDLAKEHAERAREAYAARVEIDEAVGLLERADDPAAARVAMAHLQRARERMHHLAEVLSQGASMLVVAFGFLATLCACAMADNEPRFMRRSRTRRRDEVCECIAEV